MARATFRLKGRVAVALLATGVTAVSCATTRSREPTATLQQAETPDSFGVGSGRDGDLAVAAAGTVLNSYAAVSAVNAGATQVTIGAVHGAAAGFVADDLVLLWHTTGVAAATSGDQTTVTLAGDVGAYELARVKSVAAGVLTLTNPLSGAARFATGSQVVRVPEYKTLTIGAGASVAPYPWDGSSGGIVVLFATVAIANAGAVQADAAGFRGGGIENAAIQTGCVSLNDWSNAVPVATCGGAHKGEGLFTAGYAIANAAAAGTGPAATYGRGNYANAGGGGDAHNAGGGGGGNAGVGGLGGRTWIGDLTAGVPRAVGGLGGAAVTYAFADHLVLGGGGGSGEENDMVGTSGGSGGGVVLLRVASLTGAGTVSATGGTVAAVAGNDGSGGGGAGGAVVIEAQAAASCSSASANGGKGGSGGTDPDGPGGGGAGGYVIVQAASGACPLSATGGANGTTPTGNALGPNYGATAGAAGATTPANGTGYAGPICTPAVLAANHCGGCVVDGDCPAAQPICDPTSNLCAPCNGDFGSAATHPCPTATPGRCATGGVNAGICVACLTSADCSNPTPVCSSANACAACNGDNGSAATSPCASAANPFCNTTTGACGTVCFTDIECGAASWCNNLAGAGACQPMVINGQPVPGGSCVTTVATRACVSTVCVASGALAGTCEACASDANCSGATPVCNPATATCVQCTTAEMSACTGATPVCDATKLTCAACNGDNGSAATLACPTTANPYCATAGTCGKCATNADCATGHAGTICGATTGACGATCMVDADCPMADWCTAAGVCTPKTANGQPVPAAAPINGTCTMATGARVCISGVCDTADNKCGYASGDGSCTAADAGADAGTGATVCRSLTCASSGPSSGKCACLADTDCSSTTPACDVGSGTCVQCTPANETACTAGTPTCNVAGHVCVAASSDAGADVASEGGVDAQTGDASDAQAVDASDAALVDASDAEAVDANETQVADASDATAANDAGTVAPPPSTTGGTIEGGGISCSMSSSPRAPEGGLLALTVVLGAGLLGAARRRRR